MATVTEILRRKTTWRLAIWGGAAALLATPWVAMQFTDEVAWTGFDFLVFGVMLTIAGGLCEVGLRLPGGLAYRAAVATTTGTAFLLTWANLAVGFIGDEENPANLMYAAILALVLLGALAVRFRPRAMAVLTVMAAVAQMAAGIVGLAIDTRVVGPTIVFSALWLIAAWLFRVAAETANG